MHKTDYRKNTVKDLIDKEDTDKKKKFIKEVS